MTTNPQAECAHEHCTCASTDGGFCSDYCREHANQADITCGCGHTECVGTAASGTGIG